MAASDLEPRMASSYRALAERSDDPHMRELLLQLAAEIERAWAAGEDGPPAPR